MKDASVESNLDKLEAKLENLAAEGWTLWVDGITIEPLTADNVLAALSPDPNHGWCRRVVNWTREE